MSKILFSGGLTLFILWALAVFKFHIFGFIHLLPAIALIALLARLFYNKYPKSKNGCCSTVEV